MKIGIYGYGNLGRGLEVAIKANPDMTLAGVFTRRDPKTITPLYADTKVYAAEDILNFKDQIDVLLIAGGSATDLPEMTPALAKDFHVVDSFDNHSQIPVHFEKVDNAAAASDHVALICAGWDPGMFSLNRVYAAAVLPGCSQYTFWGRGVSQGHSDAIRRIEGVLDARQYTVPVEEAIQAVRAGDAPQLTTRQKHKRECFVVAKEGADLSAIEKAIVTMPAYFADYDTTVTFITKEELDKNHKGLPHGGCVITTGKTGVEGQHNQTIEYSLTLDSNPEFTASVLAAYARAVYKLSCRQDYGCKTVFDIAPGDLSPLSPEQLRATML